MFIAFGHGYSGTKTLAKLLNYDNKVDCKHERKPFESPRGMWEDFQKVYNNEISASECVKNRRSRIIKEVEEKLEFGEINSILTFFIDGFFKLYPKMKFIHIIRDPRQHIRSIVNAGDYDGSLFPQHKHNRWDCWLKPNKKDKIYNDYFNIEPYERASWAWAQYHDFAIEKLKKIPKNQKIRIRFEDFVKGEISNLCDFLKIKIPSNEYIYENISKKNGKTPIRSKTPLEKWENLEINKKNNIINIINPVCKKINLNL